ncbi:lineage-specific thermal regulator protein [Legionella massiliensis]|uniref:Lineage-specific thermal regulator protein n=1 Tax=Legionella massiliensis TaxID=1034943 RepID=A0A078KWD9_9GAMM|nr:PadR family transcriptional regulator [Legionella massiliensis]CDZ77317.1 lineage-specific thermal regulator protein [Legionella massiliensis]CEE13055.1 lineage-specific thermal regulator protein [Legionella massiliensis]
MKSRINKTRYAVLGMLSFSPKSGYEISKDIQNSTNYFWSESDGQLYPILKQLTEEGLVVCIESETLPGKRSKKIYELTDEGHAALQDWLRQPPVTFTVRNEFLLQLFFGHELSWQENRDKIQALQTQLTQELAVYDSIEIRIKENSQDPTWLLMALAYGQFATKAEIAWCEEMIHQLEQQYGKGKNE